MTQTERQPRAYLFDAYGTLFDVHSVIRQLAEEIRGDAQALSALWRQKQIEATWLRSLMGRYADFWEITREALQSAARQLQIELAPEVADRLLDAYLRPAAFSEVKSVLQGLQGVPRAILSNGTPKMLDAAVRHNRLETNLNEVISVDRVNVYKPSPRAYALGTEVLHLKREEILFVSSNSWDAAGAKAFGYRVCWCNRSGAAPDHLGFAPDRIVSRLDQIVENG
jgi:2-haloacid dehalogenase